MKRKCTVWLLLFAAAACNGDLVGGKGPPPKALSPVPDIPSIGDEPIDDRDPTGAGGSPASGGASAGTGGVNFGSGGLFGTGGTSAGAGGSSAASGGSSLGGAPEMGGMGGDSPLGGAQNETAAVFF